MAALGSRSSDVHEGAAHAFIWFLLSFHPFRSSLPCQLRAVCRCQSVVSEHTEGLLKPQSDFMVFDVRLTLTYPCWCWPCSCLGPITSIELYQNWDCSDTQKMRQFLKKKVKVLPCWPHNCYPRTFRIQDYGIEKYPVFKYSVRGNPVYLLNTTGSRQELRQLCWLHPSGSPFFDSHWIQNWFSQLIVELLCSLNEEQEQD